MSYEIIKSLHIISVISWMVGLLYLPRLFVYHADAPTGSVQAETFKVMERRLLKAIMTPAMIASFIFGLWMLALNPELFSEPWFHVKFAAVFLMLAFMGNFRKCGVYWKMMKNLYRQKPIGFGMKYRLF